MKDGSDRFEKDLSEMLDLKDDEVAKQVWSALANVAWYRPESDEEAGYSFRAAGSMIAEIRGSGNYMDWYCCGPYATVSDHIARSMKKRGWIYDDTPEICDEPGCLNDVSCGFTTEDGYRSTCSEHYREYQKRPPKR